MQALTYKYRILPTRKQHEALVATSGCSIPGCLNERDSRGWCKKHYARWLRNGDPLATKNGKALEFYRDVVLYHNGDECLIWPFGRNSKGYATIWMNGQKQYVHRIVCSDVHGLPPTAKHEAAHQCGQGHEGCVNSRHLRWSTRLENIADQLIHGTRNSGQRNGNSSLSDADVRAIRAMAGSAKQREIAEAFGVSQQQVSAILRGKKWGAII